MTVIGLEEAVIALDVSDQFHNENLILALFDSFRLLH